MTETNRTEIPENTLIKWQKIIDLASTIEKRSEASFSHSLCTPCADQLYGHKKWYQKVKAENNGEI
ncbi:hypothetical protein [Desulfobacula sp.]|uniref:hypothetical protein n=1 Tax=Desulfobacula sp. TaxID=2593537 RepID=UPI00261DFEFE|nr:hypothetical protein [Desulfobacula sp.]